MTPILLTWTAQAAHTVFHRESNHTPSVGMVKELGTMCENNLITWGIRPEWWSNYLGPLILNRFLLGYTK